ncbi:hypothetical protein AVEN_223063-1 [Araneus ventricosus]|uniref:Uncharacterized protein n=1 Tax=Araneus ventricosus TaxID=182803 RepID=A0A4Y2FUZ9_ARAVE|nr:hypothetical protein AVEN_223063-1 [Araneus ventricosus]
MPAHTSTLLPAKGNSGHPILWMILLSWHSPDESDAWEGEKQPILPLNLDFPELDFGQLWFGTLPTDALFLSHLQSFSSLSFIGCLLVSNSFLCYL